MPLRGYAPAWDANKNMRMFYIELATGKECFSRSHNGLIHIILSILGDLRCTKYLLFLGMTAAVFKLPFKSFLIVNLIARSFFTHSHTP